VSESKRSRFGEVAIVGRPNVGKSTLLNALVGEKITITSSKPHTTRHRILGILNRPPDQAVFVDTPGHARRSNRALHRLMARTISDAVEVADVVLLLVEASGLTSMDEDVIGSLGDELAKTILVINKLDQLTHRDEVLPMLQEVSALPCIAFVPISARKRTNLDRLVDTIFAALPEGPVMYPLDMTTDRDTKFRAAELIREQLFEAMHQEVPYGLTVEIEHMSQQPDSRWTVHALIWLDRESHKPIVIGKGGAKLKRVGTRARQELIDMLGGPVHLELWAKVRDRWSDNEQELRRFGYDAR
jgi:GTPase